MNHKKKRKTLKWRLAALLLASAMAAPIGVYAAESPAEGMAKENQASVKKIRHVHVGNSEEGGDCYKKEVKHIHEGDEENGGDCFLTPVYHEHEGSGTKGGACYRTEVFHAHTGTEKGGKGCYGTPVYHRHSGSANTGGGCYGQPVYHSHTGSSAGGGCYGQPVYHSHTGSSAGGGCYGQPVYHSHTGSAATGGGCYQTPVYHTHTGSESAGGGCYGPVRHQHSDSCYREETCVMEYIGNLNIERTWTEYCYHHKNTQHVYFTATFRHTTCGAGETSGGASICWTCNQMNQTHTFPFLACGKTTDTVERYERICGKGTDTVESWAVSCGKNESSIDQYGLNCGKNGQTVESYRINCGKSDRTVDGYKLNCGKTEKNIESYALNCGKTEKNIDSYRLSCKKDKETIDGYALSCEKTGETTDSYELSCEKNEEESYAEFSVENQTDGWTNGEVTLQVSLQDGDGFLKLPEVPFKWEGEGDWEGSGETVRVGENGVYRVCLKTENEDVREEDMVLSIVVKNIDRMPPSIEAVDCSEEDGGKSGILRVTAKDIQPDGEPGSGLAQEAYSFDGGKSWQQENEIKVAKNGEVLLAVRDCCGNISTQAFAVTHIKEEEKKEPGEGNPDDGGQGNTGTGESGNDPEEGSGNGEDGDPGKDDEGGTGKDPNGNIEDGEDGGTGKDPDGDAEDGEDGGTGKDSDEDVEDGGNGGSGDGGNDGSGNGGNGGSGNSGNGGSGNSGNGGSGNGGNGGSKNSQNGGSENDQSKDPGKETEENAGGNQVAMGSQEKQQGGLKGRKNSAREKRQERENGGGQSQEAEEENLPETEQQNITVPRKEEEYQKETVQVEAKETKAEPKNGMKSKRAMRKEMAEKVVKAVTFTVSGIMLLSGLLYLVYLMFRSIQVFYCDGEGNTKYAGSCIMKKTDEGFEVRIPDMIWEHSSTGQYSLRPGKIFAKKNKGKELMVLMGDRKEAVWIDKEIPLLSFS